MKKLKKQKKTDFGFALRQIVNGRRVKRVAHEHGTFIGLHEEHGTFVREGCGTVLGYANYIFQKTLNNELVPYTPSQEDLLAHDWVVLPEYSDKSNLNQI